MIPVHTIPIGTPDEVGTFRFVPFDSTISSWFWAYRRDIIRLKITMPGWLVSRRIKADEKAAWNKLHALLHLLLRLLLLEPADRPNTLDRSPTSDTLLFVHPPGGKTDLYTPVC